MSLLPEGYKRLLYIESTGTQWIDTGFVPTATAKVVAEVQYANSTTTERSGLFIGSSHMMFGISNSKWEIYIGNKGLATSTAATTKRTVVVLDAVSKTGVVSGAVTAAAYTAFGAQSVTMPIFVLREGANSFRNYSSMKLFSYKIYNANALVRNFIPCINDAGEVGLYETVNGVFCGNSGTGTFIAGPEFWYDELEYIESTGTQWIDTGIGSEHHIVVDVKFNDINDTEQLMGQNASYGNYFGINKSGYLENGASKAFDILGTERRIIEVISTLSSQTMNVEGQTLTTTRNNAATETVKILGGIPDWSASMKLYSCQFYDGDQSILDFIPAKLPDGSIGLIDKLTEEFYPNMGTGAFVAGPDAITVPAVPADLSVSIEDSTAVLSWTESKDAAGYYVYRNGELIATTEATLFTDSIVPSVSTEYSVSAFNEFGESDKATIAIAPSAAPPAPANLRVMFADFASAQIAWNASVGATAYRVYRDGEFLVETESRIFADSGLSKDTEYVYTVTAINVVGESSASSLTVKTSDFTLVTDRTAADVEYALAQALNPDRNNTEWLKGLKGTYNATDLNRVEKAVEYVANRLEIAGWRRKPVVKIDWSFSDFPTVSEMQRYLDNIRKLRSALPKGLPAVPADMDGFTYNEANDIERLLEMLDAAVSNIMANVFYSNELYSGEVQ